MMNKPKIGDVAIPAAVPNCHGQYTLLSPHTAGMGMLMLVTLYYCSILITASIRD